jgi:tetratricopeptide (TPR) repeat protein
MRRFLLVLAMVLVPLAAAATTSEEYYAAGLTLFKQKDYEKALEYFRAALQQKSDYWEAYHSMGVAYLYLGNRTEALVAMRKSLALHPNNPDLRKSIALAEEASPWVSASSWTARLPMISIIVSLLTLGWTIYATRRRGSRFTPPQS